MELTFFFHRFKLEIEKNEEQAREMITQFFISKQHEHGLVVPLY